LKPVVQDYYTIIVGRLLWLVKVNPIEAYFRADAYRRWIERSSPTGNIRYDAQRRLMLRALKKIMDDAKHLIAQRGLNNPSTPSNDNNPRR